MLEGHLSAFFKQISRAEKSEQERQRDRSSNRKTTDGFREALTATAWRCSHPLDVTKSAVLDFLKSDSGFCKSYDITASMLNAREVRRQIESSHGREQPAMSDAAPLKDAHSIFQKGGAAVVKAAVADREPPAGPADSMRETPEPFPITLATARNGLQSIAVGRLSQAPTVQRPIARLWIHHHQMPAFPPTLPNDAVS